MSQIHSSIDFGYPTEPHGKIPAFQNIEEEAEFWDTHDITDFAEETVPVFLRVEGELLESMTIRLNQQEHEQLAERAKEIGIRPSTLVQIWVSERLREGDGQRRAG